MTNEEAIREAARLMGSARTERKAEASAQNGLDTRPHVVKVAHFESIFPHPLRNNEWQDRFPVSTTPKGRVSTYNPDYYCEALRCYIEVATSKPNIAEQGWRWREAIQRGLALRVYWWEGQEITKQFRPPRANGRKGGRPRKEKKE